MSPRVFVVYLGEYSSPISVLHISCRSLIIKDQISLLKGATFEVMQIRFNMVFNEKTGTWECGHFTYYIDDAVRGEITSTNKRQAGPVHVQTIGGVTPNPDTDFDSDILHSLLKCLLTFEGKLHVFLFI